MSVSVPAWTRCVSPRIASAVVLLLCAVCALAQVAVPPLTGRVVDLTGTLDASQKATLEQTLAAFEARKGTQIAVLLVPTTAPETIEQFSLRVAEQWKLGRKRVDDGAILVVAKNDHALRIEVGYGIEGALTDVTSHRIISEIITPAFRQGDFFGGIRAGVERMISVVDGEPLPAPPSRSSWQDRGDGIGGGGFGQMIPIAFMLALVVGGILRRVLGRFPGAVVTGGVLGGLAWLLIGALSIAIVAGIIGFVFTLLGGGMMGRPGGWQSGRGGFGGGFPGGIGGGWGGGGLGGGGGGGGFSGGGGSFGGGGASGRW